MFPDKEYLKYITFGFLSDFSVDSSQMYNILGKHILRDGFFSIFQNDSSHMK
jgi:hypothetical protein